LRCTTSQNPKRCGLLEQASRWHQRSRRALLAFERFKLLPYGTGKESGEVWGALAGHTRLEYGWTSGARAAIATLFSTILVIPGSLNIVLSRCLSTLIKAVLCGWCRSPVARRLAHTLGRMGRAKFQPAQRVRMTGWIFETQTSFAKLGLASGTARSTVAAATHRDLSRSTRLLSRPLLTIPVQAKQRVPRVGGSHALERANQVGRWTSSFLATHQGGAAQIAVPGSGSQSGRHSDAGTSRLLLLMHAKVRPSPGKCGQL